jgi:membrane protein YdbS with pleckstrin-like domain|tara:strand:+ start:4041 stop:4373 length:333 start_codon:yes stop_codon:yes gene_type:complete
MKNYLEKTLYLVPALVIFIALVIQIATLVVGWGFIDWLFISGYVFVGIVEIGVITLLVSEGWRNTRNKYKMNLKKDFDWMYRRMVANLPPDDICRNTFKRWWDELCKLTK